MDKKIKLTYILICKHNISPLTTWDPDYHHNSYGAEEFMNFVSAEITLEPYGENVRSMVEFMRQYYNPRSIINEG